MNMEEEEERKNFISILAAFKLYKKHSLTFLNHKDAYINTLPEYQQELVAKYKDHLTKIRYCIDENYNAIKKIIDGADTLFENDGDNVYRAKSKEMLPMIRPHDIEKVQITLKQIFRDWSFEGRKEREQCYDPILEEIDRYFGDDEIDQTKIKILVPGAGLGRLIYEVACRGYYCEGNEFSLFMLITSNFILNRCSYDDEHTIYPFIHQYVNNMSRTNQTVAATFPDVCPTKYPPKGAMNMVAGDFMQVYKEEDYWDCLATCFFIDCVNNIVELVEVIYKILKPGGVWINLGPLLYHFSDMFNENSIELPYEDVIDIIKNVGFKIIKTQTEVITKYAQNPLSMHQSEYRSIYFVCEKPISHENHA